MNNKIQVVSLYDGKDYIGVGRMCNKFDLRNPPDIINWRGQYFTYDKTTGVIPRYKLGVYGRVYSVNYG